MPKHPREESPSNEDSSSSDEDMDYMDWEENDEEIQVSFDVMNLEDGDWHGVHLYLNQLLDGLSFNAPDLTDIVFEERDLASVIKIPYETNENIQMEFNDIYGIFTCFNLHKYKQREGVQSLIQYMMDHCPATEKSGFESILQNEEKPCGFILNERVLNMPYQLAPPLHFNLFKDINSLASEREDLRFENFLIFTKVYSEDVKRNGKKVKMEQLYFKPEDEIYHKHASAWFRFPIMNREHSSGTKISEKIKQERLVMIINKSVIPLILDELKQLNPSFDYS
eukprot:gb/GECH01003332.1/.p1 GENE.gb/GECH01003332.1/~~gb/GECH01003332.1/.p1  ORF type:complete len:281 (+),score=92.68 gb/GECH01003332.1/:1-843(+)